MRRLLLRAEVQLGNRTLVTHTVELGRNSVFLQLPNEPPPRGEVLPLRLSFPGLVSELRLDGRVLTHQGAADENGIPGVLVELLFADEETRARLEGLLERADTATVSPTPTSPYRVLLVEDNDSFRTMFARGVERFFKWQAGCVVVDFASDGPEALRILSERTYDLLIVDYYLPGMIGSEIIGRLRAEVRPRPLAIVAMSVGGDAARDASFTAGADLFLDKPLVLRDLFATLECLATKGGGP